MPGRWRRRLLAVACLTAAGPTVIACTADPDTGEDGDAAVIWNLRQPTTTRELGAENDTKATIGATSGELDVELSLPGLDYRGRYPLVTALVGGLYADSANPSAVSDIVVYPTNVATLAELVDVLRRFEANWGFTDDDCRAVATFVEDTAALLDAAGGQLADADFGTTTAWGFSGPPLNGVQPGITIVPGAFDFSPQIVLTWDPNEPFDGDRPVIDDTADAPAVTGQDSCVPDVPEGV